MSNLIWVNDIPIAPGTPTRGEVERRADVGMMQELMHPDATLSLQEAVKELTDKVPGYKDSRGMRPLREAIAGYYKLKYDVTVDPDSIVVGLGASECFMAAAHCLWNLL